MEVSLAKFVAGSCFVCHESTPFQQPGNRDAALLLGNHELNFDEIILGIAIKPFQVP